MILMTALTVLLVLAFFLVLAIALFKIGTVLRAIGGAPDSFLAKLRLGLRAIDSETGHLRSEIPRLHQGLGQIGDGLKTIDGHLAGVIQAAQEQRRYQ